MVPIKKPCPPIWFPGTGSPESVIWAAKRQYPYMNVGALLDLTIQVKNIYFETAQETGYEPGPEHFGYLSGFWWPLLMSKPKRLAKSSCGPRFTTNVAPLSSTTRRDTSPRRCCGSR